MHCAQTCRQALQIMKTLYYIHNKIVSTDNLSSNGITRIFAIPSDLCSLVLREGEGPFSSLRNLKRNSLIFKQIAKCSSKLANQILNERNIIQVKDFVLTDDQEFSNDFIRLVDHTIRGQIHRREVYGIHYFDPCIMRIRENLKPENEFGVWTAKIDLFDKQYNRWIQKVQETSFFPKIWSLGQLFHECFFAFTNKVKDDTKKNIYTSKTESGIKVEIVISEKKVKSIYPIY